MTLCVYNNAIDLCCASDSAKLLLLIILIEYLTNLGRFWEQVGLEPLGGEIHHQVICVIPKY